MRNLGPPYLKYGWISYEYYDFLNLWLFNIRPEYEKRRYTAE